MTNQDFSNYDVYLFDWDGLLVSTQELLYLSWRTAYQEETQDDKPLSFEEWSLLHHSALIVRKMKPINEKRMRKRRHDLYDNMLRESPLLRLLDGVEPFLSSLDPHCVFIVTSSSRIEVERIRQRLHCEALEKIPYSHWFTREIYEHRKPNPDGWNRAIQLAGQEQGRKRTDLRVIGFEDSPSGVHSLLAATRVETCVLVNPFRYPDEWNDSRVVKLPHL